MRSALLEVVERGKLGDAEDFARELHIDLDQEQRGGAPTAQRARLAEKRGRTIERSVLGVFAAFCVTAAATLAFNQPSAELPVGAEAAAPVALAGAPYERDGSYETGSIGLADAVQFPSVWGRVSETELADLLEARPVRCATAGASAEISLLGLDFADLTSARAALPSGCVEETRYDLAHGAFRQRSALSEGVYLEIDGAFSLENGALCYLTSGVSAHVIGAGVSPERAHSVIARVEAQLTRLRGRSVCHSFRRADAAGDSYIADIATQGRASADTVASAPFVMRSE